MALFRLSYAGWTQARPYPLSSETDFEDTMFADAGRGSWEEVAGFVEGSGSNAFVRNLIWALADLYDLGEEGITRENWERLKGKLADAGVETFALGDTSLYFAGPDGERLELIADPLGEMYGMKVL